MNCKPGDFARVVGMPGPISGFNDAVVFLKNNPPIFVHGENMWELEKPVSRIVNDDCYINWEPHSKGSQITAHFFADSHLRPIRDPGEDARDETLSWLPVPSKEKETA